MSSIIKKAEWTGFYQRRSPNIFLAQVAICNFSYRLYLKNISAQVIPKRPLSLLSRKSFPIKSLDMKKLPETLL
jgi:hypothetical protein